MRTVLIQMREALQNIVDSISDVAMVDIEIVDRNLERVAATGYSRTLMKNRLTTNGVLNRMLYVTGEKNTLLSRPGNDERCGRCHRYGKCPWRCAVYSMIRLNGEPVGVFGLQAVDEKQEGFLRGNMDRMVSFADAMAELLSGYVKAFTDDIPRKEEPKSHAGGSGEERDGGVEAAPPEAPAAIVAAESEPMPEIHTKDTDFYCFKKKAAVLAAYSSTILLTGETGSGKELFARGIHESSMRKKGPFVAVNCGAVPEGLIESELFGHVKGAFTGASSDRHGRFVQADGGTLFLDEVENMPLYLQQRLLRVLETREVEPIGGGRLIRVDVRIVAATNQPLENLVEEGSFREDLYYRLNVITLAIPPLRKRGNDALYLSQTFIDRFNSEFGKTVRGLDAEVSDWFLKYPWKGNVRELKNVIEYGMCMCDGEKIHPEHLPEYMTELRNYMGSGEEQERQRLKHALEKYGWDERGKKRAADALGISRATLYRKISKYHLRSSDG